MAGKMTSEKSVRTVRNSAIGALTDFLRAWLKSVSCNCRLTDSDRFLTDLNEIGQSEARGISGLFCYLTDLTDYSDPMCVRANRYGWFKRTYVRVDHADHVSMQINGQIGQNGQTDQLWQIGQIGQNPESGKAQYVPLSTTTEPTHYELLDDDPTQADNAERQTYLTVVPPFDTQQQHTDHCTPGPVPRHEHKEKE